jgi:hypothetical protein
MTNDQITILAASILSIVFGLMLTTTEGNLALVIGFGAMWVGATCAFGVLESAMGRGDARGR